MNDPRFELTKSVTLVLKFVHLVLFEYMLPQGRAPGSLYRYQWGRLCTQELDTVVCPVHDFLCSL